LLDSEPVKGRARELGFELVGVSPAEPTLESLFYPVWLERGYHGEMAYLEGRRGAMRSNPRTLLPSARSVICVGLVYNAPQPYSTECESDAEGWVSRYAWGEDYHGILKERLHSLARWIRAEYGASAKCKVCVDTSPLLERAYAHRAGLGWVGKNCCLIHERLGSWFFLGEILTSLDFAPDGPAPFRCGTCRRCIDACPTDAFVELEAGEGPSHALDSRLCIAYWTIELRGSIPVEGRASAGQHVFGCDICQDVCPWNNPGRAAVTAIPAFQAENARPDLEELASLSEEEFNERFTATPIARSRYAGFLRNVAVAMGNSSNPAFRDTLKRLSRSPEPTVREHAEWALERLGDQTSLKSSESG
jgi:epoxyqueuosine reductase